MCRHFSVARRGDRPRAGGLWVLMGFPRSLLGLWMIQIDDGWIGLCYKMHDETKTKKKKKRYVSVRINYSPCYSIHLYPRTRRDLDEARRECIGTVNEEYCGWSDSGEQLPESTDEGGINLPKHRTSSLVQVPSGPATLNR